MMIAETEKNKIRLICNAIEQRIEQQHIGCFAESDTPLFLISTHYPGIWLEHIYDSVFYAKRNPEKIELAQNAIRVFIQNQTEEGQYPCYYWDPARANCSQEEAIGYSQIQECVSFVQLGLEVCEMSGDLKLAEIVYESGKRWDSWLRRNRMTRNLGLVEMFVGYDTGHDWSGRLSGLSCPGRYEKDGKPMNAKVLPPNDDVAPVIAVDMNANFYATQKALSVLAKMCDKYDEAKEWDAKALEVKQKLFEFCFDEEDVFFYDLDKNGNKRKFLSSTIFHLFLERVLDKEADKDLIRKLFTRHIMNPAEFWTEYPFPSMAVNDPSCAEHKTRNCWGYYSQALIALRCIRWMDYYGFHKEFDHICQKWLEAWTACYDEFKLGQELDPFTGKPTPTSEWYSSCMLFYLYAAERLGI